MTVQHRHMVNRADHGALYVDEVREQLLQSANRIMADHRPGDDRRCPICRVTGRWPMSQATSYLEEVLDWTAG